MFFLQEHIICTRKTLATILKSTIRSFLKEYIPLDSNSQCHKIHNSAKELFQRKSCIHPDISRLSRATKQIILLIEAYDQSSRMKRENLTILETTQTFVITSIVRKPNQKFQHMRIS